MLSDYYLVRKRRLKILDLFQLGEYQYFKGYNPAALIAYVTSVAVGLLLLKYSWLLSLPISLTFYYILMKTWIEKIYKQTEINGADNEFLSNSVNKNQDLEIDEETT